ncbi:MULTISPECIES: DUF3288 family protein [Prochlorococcus]|uniref:DUF3288 domain-containing protein n=1 Tax=Prochlorococcus marinus (strain SARG / CCMP1375 / SS120) TaxID=167539 RepID=Q7VCJ7_PROMA|nr:MULTISPECIES: DUF3288 family protein [Prochlorococcus]AAP99787.1 Uncharacterized protein Pro_0743 [Prochlorococcus marinus subsp. marinus str. CCMP1375]KGG11869.1 hypothetical protein EV04_0894 [Prochlorococcus marinus str. LG]KGG21824.1 hypothetical protein EV08_0429 [Prochlorococcus marinus str. SS2]KGG23745.1 hypothetical protein EV09_1370 [Prochlorococcus marinus str. SS35]KGG32019.1 hypothetical protein EV10_1133 [Prochlorococcus marinus str. SS51]
MGDQNHPLYSTDRENVNRLLSKNSPEDEDLIDIARLFMRYENFPGAKDLQMDMLKILKLWGITKEELHSSTREIWRKGYRPDSFPEEMLGSSFDTSENSVN